MTMDKYMCFSFSLINYVNYHSVKKFDFNTVLFYDQELHAHINGSISDCTMKKLVALKRKQNPEWGLDGKWEVSVQKGIQRTMEE